MKKKTPQKKETALSIVQNLLSKQDPRRYRQRINELVADALLEFIRGYTGEESHDIREADFTTEELFKFLRSLTRQGCSVSAQEEFRISQEIEREIERYTKLYEVIALLNNGVENLTLRDEIFTSIKRLMKGAIFAFCSPYCDSSEDADKLNALQILMTTESRFILSSVGDQKSFEQSIKFFSEPKPKVNLAYAKFKYKAIGNLEGCQNIFKYTALGKQLKSIKGNLERHRAQWPYLYENVCSLPSKKIVAQNGKIRSRLKIIIEFLKMIDNNEFEVCSKMVDGKYSIYTYDNYFHDNNWNGCKFGAKSVVMYKMEVGMLEKTHTFVAIQHGKYYKYERIDLSRISQELTCGFLWGPTGRVYRKNYSFKPKKVSVSSSDKIIIMSYLNSSLKTFLSHIVVSGVHRYKGPKEETVRKVIAREYRNKLKKEYKEYRYGQTENIVNNFVNELNLAPLVAGLLPYVDEKVVQYIVRVLQHAVTIKCDKNDEVSSMKLNTTQFNKCMLCLEKCLKLKYKHYSINNKKKAVENKEKSRVEEVEERRDMELLNLS